ncbi:ribbon-helix-helix domain-containing protein [Proteus mirabilis]|uniref:ribbon-helix-helix domain-containing protein n=1 Tax=Proteus mirabilis TaxID=584 RepID=UPI001071F3CD|nr:ribbon-helix-helix domain-containing protein [Proteus mirabilis]MBS3884954.1 ribbon-helix-helix protein, CopG family [Proteus mirabilis]TFU09890.1 ribbon-helix-helix protein, CopG family [Proteus mirabilis]TFU09894.1 ribbon-helix-helix protein, CopG family [Proteus mirabilis]
MIDIDNKTLDKALEAQPKAKQATLTIRLDDDMAKTFKGIVEREGYTQALVIREFIKRYIKKNGQGDLFK